MRLRRMPSPTRAGWSTVLIALGLFGAGVNTGNNLFYLLFALLIAAFAINLVVAGRVLRKLNLDLQLPERGQVKARLACRVGLTNDARWLPAPQLRCQVGTDSGVATTTTPGLQPGERGEAVVRPVPKRRGWFGVDDVRLSTTFPFGLVGREVSRSLDARVLVHPRLDRSGDVWGVQGHEVDEGAVARSGSFAATKQGEAREYQSGDDPRFIDWRASARTTATIWRQPESESSSSLLIEMDRRETERFEARVSRVAGMAVVELSRGRSVGIKGREVLVAPSRGPQQERKILDWLALAEARQ